MAKTGLNIVQVLRESQKTRKQVTSMYVEYDDINKKINGYCAMGALFCESDNVSDIGTMLCGDPELFECYGIKYNPTQLYACPKCEMEQSLSAFIIHLNDREDFTFEEIAKVLEELKL